MKINAKKLLECLNDVKKAVKKTPIQPVLANVLIEAHQKGMGSLTGSDLETTVVRRFEFEAGSAGQGERFLVNGAMLKKILERNTIAEDDEIDVFEDGRSLAIATPYSIYTLPRLDPATYPDVHHKFKDGATASISPSLLKAFADAKPKKSDPARPLDNSIIFTKDLVYSTDGHHLFRLETECSIDEALSVEGALVMADLMTTDRLDFAFNNFCYRSDELEAFVRANEKDGLPTPESMDKIFVMEGTPVFEACKTMVEVDRQEFIGALQRVNVVIEAGMVMDVVTDGTATLTSSPVEICEAREQMAVSVEGTALKIGFNPDLLIKGLAVMPDEMVQIRMNHPANPICFRSGPLSFALMPMKLN